MTRPTRFPGSTYIRRASPEGFGIQFEVNDDNSVFARFEFDTHKEGPPGYAHGGAVGGVLDEAMGTAAFESERLGFTVTMTVNYHVPVPLKTPIEVRARVERIEGSKTFTSAEIVLPNGDTAADSQGIFIVSEKLLEFIARAYGRQKE